MVEMMEAGSWVLDSEHETKEKANARAFFWSRNGYQARVLPRRPDRSEYAPCHCRDAEAPEDFECGGCLEFAAAAFQWEQENLEHPSEWEEVA